MKTWISNKLNLINRLWSTRNSWPNLVGWWLLGFFSEFGYWVVATATHDLVTHMNEHSTNQESISSQNSTVQRNDDNYRFCNNKSAGILLFPLIIPALCIILIIPFLPFRINLKVICITCTAVSSFVLAPVKVPWWVFIIGIAMTSAYWGLSIITFIRYMSLYHNSSTISAWSSGVGASGLLASLYYLAMTEANVERTIMFYSLLIIPIIISFSYWVLITKPKIEDTMKHQNDETSVDAKSGKNEWKKKIRIAFEVCRIYGLPYSLVFLFQYTINQGMFELIRFGPSVMRLPSRVRWLNFVYLFSNFIFKSSGGWFETSRLWLLAAVELGNLLIMISLAVFNWTGEGNAGFGLVIILVLFQGAVSGISYVNTYKRMNKELDPKEKDFSFSIALLGEPVGILAAGGASLLIHNVICSLPLY